MRKRNANAAAAFILRAALALVCVAALGACNIFSPFHTPGASDNVDDLVSDAREALDEENYTQALVYMDKAMRIDPGDPRVRYLHAVATVKVHGIDLIDIVEIFQPGEGQTIVSGDRVLFLSGAELGNLFAAFSVVRTDLEPLVNRMVGTGRELSKIRESDDVLMSYGISETLLGMLRILDNDDTPGEFTLDDRVVIEKTDTEYVISLDASIVDPFERDRIVDAAIEYGWPHLVAGRAAFYLYYQFVINRRIWTDGVPAPPMTLPQPVDRATVVGDMADFVDEGVRALYDEKEDL